MLTRQARTGSAPCVGQMHRMATPIQPAACPNIPASGARPILLGPRSPSPSQPEAAVVAAVQAGGQLVLPPMEIAGHGTFAIYLQGGNDHGPWQQ